MILAETFIDSQNRQSSAYCDSTDSEADYESTEASVIIEDTEVADVNSYASQVFQRNERSVESDDGYSVSLRTSMANSIESLRRRGVKSHDVLLEDFVVPETEKIGNRSDEYFDDFVRSEKRNPSLQVPTELYQDTENSEVVIVAEEIPDYSKKHKEAFGH